ncbi:MAG: endolytic transglycosylase MltG [Desulfobulbus sp.]|nr:endolytic transglycosylase MltG [Desulfobulbus sp.]
MRRFLLILLSCVVLCTAGLGLWYHSYLTTPAPGQGEIVITIPQGMGVHGIGKLLASEGLLKNDIRYLCLVYLSGNTARLKAGEYSITRGLTPPAVLQLLVDGRTLRHRLTIPEGMDVEQVAQLFSRDGWIKNERFLHLTRDAAFISRLGVEAPSLEGYLFPETYTLVRNEADEQSVLKLMVARFQQVWEELAVPEAVNGLNRHQLVILASIVERETGAAEERPLIARVFLNRLKRKMRLQSDPTVIYGLLDFNGNITKADLKRETPYNTYVIPALPVGPICNPGRAALEAVVHPAESNALYFVSRNDGTHVFSTNLADHNRAVRQYQRGR